MLRLSCSAVRRYRLHVNHLTDRLPAGQFAKAARAALQDSWPQSGLLSLHARVDGCPASAWEDLSLAQTYSPRAAVHLVPRADFGVFTIGRLPVDTAALQAIETVEIDGTRAWVALSDVETLRTAGPMHGVRFLPAEELRLLEIARLPRYDTFHPHALLVDGELIGSWGRRGGTIHVLLDRPIPARIREAIEAEAVTIPVPAASIRLRITECAA